MSRAVFIGRDGAPGVVFTGEAAEAALVESVRAGMSHPGRHDCLRRVAPEAVAAAARDLLALPA